MTTTELKSQRTKLQLQRHSIEVQIASLKEQIHLMAFYLRMDQASEAESMVNQLKNKLSHVEMRIGEIEREIERKIGGSLH